MTTVAERLKTISGLSGATVTAMLLAIGTSGNTMAERLVSYSGLPTGTVTEHLLVDGGVQKVTAVSVSVRARGDWVYLLNLQHSITAAGGLAALVSQPAHEVLRVFAVAHRYTYRRNRRG